MRVDLSTVDESTSNRPSQLALVDSIQIPQHRRHRGERSAEAGGSGRIPNLRLPHHPRVGDDQLPSRSGPASRASDRFGRAACRATVRARSRPRNRTPGAAPWYGLPPMSPGETRPALREWTAVFAYVALWVGYLPIGFVTQQRDVIAGLWVTEALAIALPAVILVRGANLRAASYLGLRAPTLKQLAVAVVLAAANQPVVSLLTWGSREVAPAAWVEEFDSFQRVMDVIFAGQAVPMI